MSKIPDDEKDIVFKRYEAAFIEFQRDAKVTTICCHACGGLLVINALGPEAWQSSCPCGKYNGTLRGL